MRISIRERGINHALVLIELKYYGAGVVLCPTETLVDHFSEIHAYCVRYTYCVRYCAPVSAADER